MILHQIQALGENFTKTGGLREQMTAARLAVRAEGQANDTTPAPPSCPICGKPMRKRTKKQTGEPFWGCTAYTSGCRGTRPFP